MRWLSNRLGGESELERSGSARRAMKRGAGLVLTLAAGTSGALLIPASPALGAQATSVSAGTIHSCAVVKSGKLRCWGNDDHGRASPRGGRYRSVSGGGSHTCGVLRTGRVRCWGWDTDGQATPRGGRYRSVSAGGFHTCGVLRNEKVRCWGNNSVGQSTVPPALR